MNMTPIIRYAKLIVAFVGACAVALQAALTDGVVTNQEWLTIVISVLTALGVWGAPHRQKDQTPPSRADMPS